MLSNSRETSKIHVVGYLDDDFNKHGIRYSGTDVLGSTQDVNEIVRKHDVGIILYAIHNISQDKREEILKKCEATGAQVIVFPDIIGHISEAIKNNGHSDGQQEPEAKSKISSLLVEEQDKNIPLCLISCII